MYAYYYGRNNMTLMVLFTLLCMQMIKMANSLIAVDPQIGESTAIGGCDCSN